MASTDPGVCRGLDGPCGRTAGDPHLSTFDGSHFDLQAVGEFVTVHSSTGDMDVQVRQSPFRTSRTVAVDTAVAMRVGGQRLGFYLDGTTVVVHRDGAVAGVPLGTSPLTGGAKINHVVGPLRGNSFAVSWPDGSVAWVQQVGAWGLQVDVQPRSARKGKLTGLFGPFNDDQGDDVSTADGKPLARPPLFDELYHAYAAGWRVTAANSLFDYDQGHSTKDYTDLAFPDRPSGVDTPPVGARDAARSACTLLGVVDPGLLADCVLDLASTGQGLFAVAAARLQAVAGTGSGAGAGASGSGSAAPTQTLTVGSPGAIASVPFDGTAGQRVYVEVTATTLPDSGNCAALELVRPGGGTVALGCVQRGRGYLDGTLLTVTGRYQIVIKPGGRATGTVTLRLTTSTDSVAPITPDGPAVTATVNAAGQQARLTFTAPKDEKVFVDILGSTLPTGCAGGIKLVHADGSDSAIGCTNPDGRGLIDTTALKAGAYVVLIDPAQAATGSATVRLTVVQDQRQSIVLNGGSVSAVVAEAGATSRLTFSASAGQKVTVDGTSATLPANCGQLLLLDPAGAEVDLGCVSHDHTASMGPTTLKATGTYTIVLDGLDQATGSVLLRVHT